MDIEVLVLCDAATDSIGKLNVLGVFDSILAASAPIIQPQCAVALRIRFSREEEGAHAVKVSLVDADGKSVVPDLNATVNVKFRGDELSLVTNMIMNLQRVKFEKAGDYVIGVSVDGKHEKAVPLMIRLRPPQPQ